MILPSISSLNRGFTLVEILIVTALFSFLLWLGLFVEFDTYRATLSRSDENTLVSLLGKARSRSMANLYESKWGVCYESMQKRFVLFKGGYVAGAQSNDLIDANPSSVLSSSPATFLCSAGGVTFAQLGGTTTPISISLTEQARTKQLSLNYEGTIIW